MDRVAPFVGWGPTRISAAASTFAGPPVDTDFPIHALPWVLQWSKSEIPIYSPAEGFSTT